MGGRAGGGRASRQGLPSQRRGRAGPAKRLRVPEARAAYAAAIADSAELMAADDALDAEIWVASNISAMRIDVPTDEAFTVLLLDLIDEAERDGRAGCAVLLAAMAAVGPREVAEAAGAAANRVTGRASRRRRTTAEAGGRCRPGSSCWAGPRSGSVFCGPMSSASTARCSASSYTRTVAAGMG